MKLSMKCAWFRWSLVVSIGLTALVSSAAELRRESAKHVRAHAVLPLDVVAVLELGAIDREALMAEDEASKAIGGATPLRFASPVDLEVSPQTDGTWEVLADGTWLWRLRVHAPSATDLSFGFSTFALAPGATLYMVSEDYDSVRGPYTAADVSLVGDFWTPVVAGERTIIELHEPASEALTSRLVLARVGRGYRDMFGLSEGGNKQGSCNIDVACQQGDQWRDEIRSVARITIDSQYLCTATLIMDVPGSYTPYMLTAYHCQVRPSNASTVVVYWNFESPLCGLLGSGSLEDSQSGTIYRAGRQDNDMCLLELEEDPDPSFNVFFAGIDARATLTPQSSVGIHHPQGDEKAISFNNDALTTTDNCDPNVIGVDTHWLVDDWEEGTTETGSSGSALFNPANHRMVGYLSGGAASCDEPFGFDCYGKMSVGWDSSSSSSRLRDWLDPASTGNRTVAGSNPSGPSNHSYVVPATAHISGSGGTHWRTDVAVVNRSGSSANLNVTYYPESGNPLSWNGSLGNNQTVEWQDVLVSRMGLANGANSKGTFHVASSVPLIVTSRTYNQESPTRTYGQYLPGLEVGEAIPQGRMGVVPHLKGNSRFRTNLGVVNLGSSTGTAIVRLYNASGQQVGNQVSIRPTAGQLKQVNDIFGSASAGTQNIAYATVEVQTSGAKLWAYASVVDQNSSDPTTVPVMVTATSKSGPANGASGGVTRASAVFDRTKLRRTATPPVLQYPALAHAPNKAAVNILTDGFEGSFPGATWEVFTDGSSAWGSSSHRAYQGVRSVWCVGGGTNPVAAGGDYPANLGTWMIYGPFSLADASAAQTTFRYWMETELEYDTLFWGVSINGTNFTGFGDSGSTGGWTAEDFDFSDATNPAVLGEPEVWFAFKFTSDSSVQFEGVYVDELSIDKTTSGGGCTVSCSASAPSTASVGQSVSFSGSATPSGCSGSVGYSWTFGDGATSSQRNPGHSYSSSGAYTWRMTASVDGQSCQRSGVITVSGASSNYVYVVPAAAHLPGSGGTQWRTDVAVVNLSGSNANLSVTYYPESGNPLSWNGSLGNNRTVEWQDVLVSRMGLANGANSKGTLHVAASVPLMVTSRTYNQESFTRTYGQYLPGLEVGEAIPQGRFGVVPHLKGNSRFRTNLGVVNLGSSTGTAIVRLYNASGQQVGSQVSIRPTAGQLVQVNDIFGSASAGTQNIAYATVEVQTSGAKLWAYASVVDQATGDPTTVPVEVQ